MSDEWMQQAAYAQRDKDVSIPDTRERARQSLISDYKYDLNTTANVRWKEVAGYMSIFADRELSSAEDRVRELEDGLRHAINHIHDTEGSKEMVAGLESILAREEKPE